jgi:hypothetical protein
MRQTAINRCICWEEGLEFVMIIHDTDIDRTGQQEDYGLQWQIG